VLHWSLAELWALEPRELMRWYDQAVKIAGAR
jgi:hypothetical protein